MKRKKFIQYWSVPTLLFLVACFQIYQVEFEEKSRWKGGGFGMYTTIHPFNDEIWIDDEFVSTKNLSKRDSLELQILTLKVKVHPSKHQIKNLVNWLDIEKDSVKIQIFKPQFDLENSVYTKTLRYETTYKQD
ncbi:hypothetical protein [Psychroflexus aestuariivivens]|uniref:hypothetical protein n=1 Tax=Psychroflexus aestuariivivens TaxID=1795040 RepID=UPI000FDBB9D9|nr:hypothetical protein [Psychroflexus aestuariivivens]